MRKSTGSTKDEADSIEAEYIKNLQQQIYFLELETNYLYPCRQYEPRHDKTNKMSVRPAKTQISLGIRPVWSESSLSAWRNLGSLATH